MAKYNIEEVKELWKREPDDDRVFRAATEDIDDYSPEVRAVIKAEAKRRREAQAVESDTNKVKEKLQKVIKSLIVVTIVIACGVIVYDHVNERTISMIGGGIILMSLAAIWKPKKLTKDEQEKPKD